MSSQQHQDQGGRPSSYQPGQEPYYSNTHHDTVNDPTFISLVSGERLKTRPRFTKAMRFSLILSNLDKPNEQLGALLGVGTWTICKLKRELFDSPEYRDHLKAEFNRLMNSSSVRDEVKVQILAKILYGQAVVENKEPLEELIRVRLVDSRRPSP